MSQGAQGREVVSQPTIFDVAKLAGVSKSTVSRVLDGRRNSGSPHAQRVRQAASELGYQRNIFASGMRRGETNTIGLIVPRLTDTTMAVLYEEISKACQAEHKLAIVATSENSIQAVEQAVDTLLERRVDGLILTTDQAEDPTVAKLRKLGVPHVCALRTEGLSDAALGDDVQGAYLATSHLLELGHRRIALINGPGFASSARGRSAGYCQAHEEAGIEVDASLMRETDFTTASAEHQMGNLLEGQASFSACFAATDNLAVGAISALRGAGRSVPQDVSVVGYNDIPLARYLSPPLSTVRIPFDEIARNCLELLREQVAGAGDTHTRVSEPELVVRDTTQRYR